MTNRHRRTPRFEDSASYRNMTAPAPVNLVAPVPYYPAGPSVHIQTLGSKNSTVGKVSVTAVTGWNSAPDYQFEVAESAKREQGDKYDPVTGELIALGRAFQKLGRRMVSEGSKRVQALADERAHEQVKRSRPQTYHRTREEWEAIQAQRRQEGAEQIAANLGFKREEFVTVEEWHEQRQADVQQAQGKVEEWGGFATVVPKASTHKHPRIELADGRVITVEGNQVVMYGPGEGDFQGRTVLFQD